MQHHARFLATAAMLTAALASQQFREDFNFPNGTAIPGWTAQRGNWQIVNGRAVALGSTWSYLTKDGLSATRSVLDGEFFFVGSGIQFAGFTSLHPGTNLDTDLLMVKIQNNGGAADFDILWSYERGTGGGSNQALPSGTQSAYCRMITLDNEFWIECDADQDGLYETSLVKPIAAAHAGTLVGMSGFNGSEMDNFEFFDAVLRNDPASTPTVGQNHTMRLNATQANATWFGMLALGNSGFPVGNRQIPVSPDFLAVGTFANPGFGMVGNTDANADATVTIPIPAMPFLVGFRIYAAVFTFDASAPLGVGNISNEQAFVIQ